MDLIVFGYLVVVVCVTVCLEKSASADCNKTECPGPLAYYNALGCKPVYRSEADCCAYKYNCDSIKNRSTNKCYVNGHEYEIGEKLRDEDANPCDIGCTCTAGYDSIATFNCAIVDCFDGKTTPGCYKKSSPLNCCSGEEVCPENPEDRAICNIDGKEYRDGEHFTVSNEPDLSCICQPGYKGENVEPFCAKPKHPYCDPSFHHAGDIVNNCSPVYYNNQSPQTSCSVSTRCQNANDTIISTEKQKNTEENLECLFGNMTLSIGESLNEATDYSSVCVKCVCEVPPILTCQRKPDEECDVTNHPPFHTNFSD